ncbi:hypothetical protein F5Y09DRAFT_303069 [Xylaria sp. FL1042]|nr:hypothetical protein F5Y09DRAFT_303069 [Xylaria sp. FL1042]
MVQVRLSTRPSADGAGSGARQTSHVSGDGHFISLPSRPEPSRDAYSVPCAEFNFRFSPDTILPSVERSSTAEETPYLSTPSTPVAQVPSVSVTPSGTTSLASRDDTINGLGSELRGLCFSASNPSMDMASISNALLQVVAEEDSRSRPFLDPMSHGLASPSPGRPGSRSRRSSSRIILEKHDVRDEAPPNDRFSLPGLQKALGDTKKSMTELVDVLGSSAVGNEPDSIMKRLHGQAKDLSQFESPSRRIVGFVGDSGAGKSSLLNSLLDRRELARSSNGGGACTCVVTEFHFHEDERLAIVVERFSEDELVPQLKSLLQDYRHFHLDQNLYSSQGEVADLANLENRAGLARSTFQVMFPEIFKEEDTFLRETEAESISTLNSWVENFDQSMIQGRRFGLSLDECSSWLMQLSSDTSSERTSLWPWIKKIIVYLNANILSKGLVLVDLPGLRDLNAARRNITERYLLKCDEIFVVAAEGRATTDEGVRSVIELAKNAKLSNVGIVCTRSDEIKPTEALKDWKGKSAANEIQQKLDAIKQEKSLIRALEAEEASYDEIEPDEFQQIIKELRFSKGRLRDYEFDLQQFLITTRNAIVERKLLDLYKQEVPDNQLRVFCASNAIYWDWRDEPKDKSMPHLRLSGILAIRQHCMSMVSESRYIAALKYMRDDIGVLLAELDLWIQSGQGSLSAERKESIRNTLDALEGNLCLELCGRTSGLKIANTYKREFDTNIYQQQVERMGRWGVVAKVKSEFWAGWHHSSYAAFCRNYGIYRTEAAGRWNWNEEIIGEMTNDLNPPWEQLQTSLDRQGEEIVEFINNTFEEAEELLDTELNGFPDTTGPIASTLLSQKRGMEVDIEAVLDDLRGDLRTLRTDALSGIRTSFIGKAMEDAYENARREKGRGCDARRKAIINSAVTRNGLFADLLRSFKRGFNECMDNTQERMQQVVGSHLDAIRGTFDIIRSDNVSLECEKDPEFRRRVEERLMATKEEMTRICDSIAF